MFNNEVVLLLGVLSFLWRVTFEIRIGLHTNAKTKKSDEKIFIITKKNFHFYMAIKNVFELNFRVNKNCYSLCARLSRIPKSMFFLGPNLSGMF